MSDEVKPNESATGLPVESELPHKRMKFVVLSQRPELYSTQRVVKAVEARGHECQLIDYRRCYMKIASHRPTITYEGQLLEGVDAVIPRIAAAHSAYGTAVVRQFEMMNVYCVNGSQAIARARDKLRCLQILSRHHVGIPQSAFVREKDDVLPAIHRVGGEPVVIKLLEGTQGIGVLLAESVRSAEAIIELLQSQKQNVLIQKFVAESRGRDIRAFVVGDQVVAAMRRVAQGQEFRSN
ncbi:MAG: RimK family alpha-L-glutamate ligase, partial [Myxococcales bacterium]|nr:RimK family alpha-L-glutamate ligase [Myxococcales bacterium]